MRTHRFQALTLSLLLMSLSLSSCRTWRPSDMPPERTIRVDQPRTVRLTQTDGERVYVRSPVMDGDSVVGEALRRGPAPVRIAVPIAAVQEAATSELSLGRTVAAIVLPAGVLLALIVSQMTFVSYPSF